jgi:hypothetical protein
VDLLDNTNHIYDINIRVNDKGLVALKEYIWKIIKTWRILIVAIASILAAVATIT